MNSSELSRLEPSWKARIGDEFQKPYMQSLLAFLEEEYRQGKTIFPQVDDIFAAFNHTPFDRVRVVIMGQDPYHGPGQAHGLCFSVKPGVPIPPSLQNIFKELQSDLGVSSPRNGSLIPWADQGVLLLNATLTVESGKAGSHHKRGWEQFTDRVIQTLNAEKSGLIFILWGSPAQKKCSLVDETKHQVLKAPHPSPLSSYRGFFGCRHFSKVNEILRARGETLINWQL